MASELLPAVFGAIGTLVGGGVTLTANWITARTQHRVATEDRRQKNAEVRRDAYSAFLAAAELFQDRGRELVERISPDAPNEKIESAHAAFYEAWEDAKRKRTSVLISGPEDIVPSVNKLRDKLAEFYSLCNNAYNNRSERRPRGYLDTLETTSDAMTAFATLARKFAVVDESRPTEETGVPEYQDDEVEPAEQATKALPSGP
jgi:hypothetical protein